MATLKKLSEFVLNQTKKSTENLKLGGVAEVLHLINEYTRFITQKPTLGILFPISFKLIIRI